MIKLITKHAKSFIIGLLIVIGTSSAVYGVEAHLRPAEEQAPVQVVETEDVATETKPNVSETKPINPSKPSKEYEELKKELEELKSKVSANETAIKELKLNPSPVAPIVRTVITPVEAQPVLDPDLVQPPVEPRPVQPPIEEPKISLDEFCEPYLGTNTIPVKCKSRDEFRRDWCNPDIPNITVGTLDPPVYDCTNYIDEFYPLT